MQRPRSAAADPGELAARFFRALYQAYDLHQVDGIHVAVPTGTPCFADRSLGALARQIGQHHDPARQGSTTSRDDPVTTGRGAATSRRGVFDVDEDRAAEAFRLVWGQAYDIAFTAGTWRACRLDENETLITGKTPDGLTVAIRTDWARRSAP